jgi:hypothetical protein
LVYGVCAFAVSFACKAAIRNEMTPQQVAKPRVIVISDIGNEPDDQMSLVRFLLYSNGMDVEALIAATSTWQKSKVSPDIMQRVIAAYGKVRPNLLLHADGWPSETFLSGRVVPGQPIYGLAGIGSGMLSPGAQQIIAAADREDPRPLWITIWGGANTLAQALLSVRESRPPQALAKFVAKLRVYSISDQDDAGPWIRREFPSLFYIVKPSLANGEAYAEATWTGISGDEYYRNCDGADFNTVTNAWLDANVRSKGTLGASYPRFLFIMEGDTPSFLGLIDNGLDAAQNPSWGGWGGRYLLLQPYGETHPIWSQGGDLFHRVTSADTVSGKDGRIYTSDQASIWRWREAFQNDFAARMSWTVTEYAAANHPPIVVVNGRDGTAPLFMDAVIGERLTLDSKGTHDPDGDELSYLWFHYPEAGAGESISLGNVELQAAQTPIVTVTPTATCRPDWLARSLCPKTGVAHIILAVTDSGTPRLTRYRRVVLNIRAP